MDESAKEVPTKAEKQEVIEKYNQQQKEQYAKRQAKKFDRLEEYSLDTDNKKIYEYKRKKWTKQVELCQKNRGKKVMITEQAIEKIRMITLEGLTEDNNQYVREVHKELLQYAQNSNDSNEVACIINLTNNTRTGFVKGERHYVDIYSNADVYHYLKTMKKNTLLLCHNHPGLTDFSANDINVFMSNSAIKTMTIVTNDGAVKYISKGKKFNHEEAIDLMRDCLSKTEGDIEKSVAEFLKECYSVGIERK